MKRRDLITLIGGAAAAWPAFARAQMQGAKHRVGILTGGSVAASAPLFAAFRQRMEEAGYVEGRNLVLATRSAAGRFDRLPVLVHELLRESPHVLLVATTPASLAAKAATTSIPIVFVAVADPIGVGLVDNLARPRGNITGVTNINAELTGKRLELLKQIMPAAARIAVLVNPDDANAELQMRQAHAAAKELGFRLDPVVHLRGAGDLARAFELAERAGAAAALRMVDPTNTLLRAETVALAAKHRLPVMYAFREDVAAGGLIAYGTDLRAQFRQAAELVDKVLRGAKPADLPVEQPTRIELAINVKAAKALGLTIPPALLARADEVIE